MSLSHTMSKRIREGEDDDDEDLIDEPARHVARLEEDWQRALFDLLPDARSLIEKDLGIRAYRIPDVSLQKARP